MEESLKDLVDKAILRGHRYLKGGTSPAELPDKIAELGVFLLERARMIETADTETRKAEIIDIQNKIDDLRKVLFATKLQTG